MRKLNWYTASILMWVRIKEGKQETFPVWENVVLIKAFTMADAFKKAKKLALEDENNPDESFTWGKRPAEWIFGGIRKIKEISRLNSSKQRIDHSTKITYSKFELDSETSLKDYIEGNDVTLKYLKLEESES